MVQLAKELPPFICFEIRLEEDREKTIETGQYSYKEFDYVLVTPRGSRDTVERRYAEWLAHIEREAANGRFPQDWLSAIKAAYADWKAGREAPITGTPVRTWTVLGPGQQKLLEQCGIRSIEELASANEEALARIGMGGRALRDKARAWLEAAANTGKLAENVAALQVANEQLLERNKDLETRLRNAEAQLPKEKLVKVQ